MRARSNAAGEPSAGVQPRSSARSFPETGIAATRAAFVAIQELNPTARARAARDAAWCRISRPPSASAACRKPKSRTQSTRSASSVSR